MRLLFLHGRPGVGKLTVARHLATATGLRLFHNHLAVDTALALYDFGTPGFVALRASLWEACFRQLADDPVDGGVIFTFSAEATVPQRWLDTLFAHFAEAGHDLIVVELVCDEAELERRMASGSREEHGKLTDVALYRQLRAGGTFDTPVVPVDGLRIDTTHLDAEETAGRILDGLGWTP